MIRHTRLARGFTLVEVIIAIAVIAVLAGIGYVSYNGLQERAATAAVQDSLRIGSELLEVNFTKHRDYPPNMAGTGFIATEGVATVLLTNAPYTRVHSNLTPDENVQLFLNTCNAHMPIVLNGDTYNTICEFSGKSVNIHINGQRASNFVMKGPTIPRSEFNLKCGPECKVIEQLIMDQFAAQGGTWPLEVSRNRVSLPEPNLVVVTGNATKYCLEGRYNRYPEITVGHITSEDKSPREGPCPPDPDLYYLPPEPAPED